jgi:alpha-tubulin suppressor-like RCC1 family protein
MKRSLKFPPVTALLNGTVLLAELAATIVQTHAASCTPPPAGIVGWWPGEGNANDIVGGDNGTLEGDATFAPAEVGQGFRLDGTNGYVQIPDSVALKPTNVTVEAWVWLDPNVSPASNEQIVFKQNSWSYFFEGYTILKAHIDNGDGTFTDRFQAVVSANGDQIAINSITAVQRGVWYHVAATYDGNQLTLYVNGVAEASAIAGFPLDYGTEPVFIGTTGVPGNYINWFAGIIDEASIYNRALASNEIAAIYNAGSAGKCTATSTAVPVISSFAPATGASGTVVTISGNSFSPTPASNIVYFGAVQANVLTASTNSLTVTVPVSATFAPITVTVNGLTAWSGQMFEPTFTGDGSSVSSTSFAPSFNLPAAGPGSCVIADLDGDGKPDIAFVDAGNQSVSIYQNISTNGALLSAASFAPRVDLPFPAGTGNNAYRLRAVDLDGDGKLDLIACEAGGSNVTIFHNISVPGSLTTNSFEPAFDLPTGNDCRFAAAADLDGDGRPDIVALNYGDKTISLFKNIGSPGILNSNSFAQPVILACPGGPYEVAIADLDGDGKPDLAVTDADTSTLSIFQNTMTPGTITVNSFALWIDLPAQNGNATIAAVDLDGDGKLDLVTGSVNSETISIYQNISAVGMLTTNSFAPRVDFSTGCWTHTVAIADFNGDGKPDICDVGELPSVMSIFQNASTPGGFSSATLAPRVDFGTGWNAWGIAAGDLDGDGRPDIVFCNYYDNNIQIYQNQMPFGTPTAAPTIILQPTNLTVTVSNTAVFTVTANGSLPLNYQWNFNGTNISDATNATLTLDNVQPWQAGNYFVTVSNLTGGVVSSNAVLTVYVPPTPPIILSQTPDQVVLLGSTATFSLKVTSTDPLIYFWQRNGVLIPGATNASYSLFNAQLSDSGSTFSCLVTNAYGLASSTNVSLKVIDSTVANDLCSGAIVIASGSYTNVQSTVQATSFGDPVPDCVDGFGHGVWYQFTAPVTGQLIVDTFGSDFDTGLAIYTGSCDALTEMACNDDVAGVGVTSQVTIPTTAGTTYFIIAGGYDSDAGNLVLHLNHLTPPAFAVQPTNESVVISNTASFSATLTGALPMGFQWSFNGTPLVDDGIHIAGSATASLSISNITTADAGSYTLAVINFLGSTNSAAAVLTVLTPPTFTTQPVGRSVPPGLPTIFNAAATGNPMPSYYQWQLNGTNIPGASSSSYTNLAVGTNDLGFYQVIASNSVAATVSAGAQLTFGPVAAWGLNSSGQCLPPPGLSNVVAVAGSYQASFAVRTDGTIATWGSGNGNATNIPAGASNIVAIAASGNTENYALRSDGGVVGWNGVFVPPFSNIVAIAAGFNFGCALRAEGTLTGWGAISPSFIPSGLNHVTAIACQGSTLMVVRSDGTVVVSGTGAVTNVPNGLSNVVAVAAGYTYVMALKADGTVAAWGSGTGTNLPPGMTNIVTISAGNWTGENFGMAVRSDGNVLTWGDNPYGETSPPAALTDLFSIAGTAAVYHGLALVNDGRPITLQPPIGLTAYTGRSVTLQGSAVGAQPLSYRWLLNGTNVPGATNASLILPNVQFGNAGNYQLFVSNSVNTTLSLPAPLNVISNSALTFLSVPADQTNYQGSKVTLGATVLGSGPVSYQWYYSTNIQDIFTAVPGANSDSLVFDPALAGQSGYYRVVASNQFSSVTSPSTYERVLFAKAWGYLPADPPFVVTNATAIAVGNLGTGNPFGHYLVLKSDGTISSWIGSLEYPQYGQTNFSALSNSIVTAIAAGYGDSLALKSDGTVYATGFGIYGETNVPSGLSGVTAIACGDYHDLALKYDGTIAAWGQNNYGQATNAAYAPQYGYIPVTNVVAIAAGGNNSIALHADGSVVTWGQYGNGEYPVPSNVTNIIAVAAGGTHFLALRANGTVVGWGSNPYGQTTIPATWSNIVAISAGGNHSVALRNDGTILTLGNYINGPTLTPGSVPSDLANVVAIASSGDHDLGLFGTRAPLFTVQPWDRTIFNTATSVWFSAKCAGVQPVSYQWQLNGTNVPGATNDMLTLNATITNTFTQKNLVLPLPSGVYQIIASNAYGVVASKFAKLTVQIPLAVALNATNLAWTTSGNALWFGETNITHDGVSAAQSGGIGPLQQTILQTTVSTNWPGSYTFWWNVSSEQDFDILEFRINGIVQTSISGSPGWQQVSIPVAAGTNTLEWRYYKDATIDVGLDAGWVDQFAYVPSPPEITVQPVSQTVNMGANVTFSITAIGPGINYPPFLRYQWYQNGNPVGFNGPSFTLNNVGRAQNGTYFVTVTNISVPGSITVSSNAVLQVLVPQLLGSPQLLPNGSFQLTSTDADGRLLAPSDLPNFTAQASTNLVNWVALPNALSLTNGILLLQDNSSSNYTTRYYRIIEQ